MGYLEQIPPVEEVKTSRSMELCGGGVVVECWRGKTGRCVDL